MRFDGREYKTLARLGDEVVAGIKSPYSYLFLHYKQFLYVCFSPLYISPHSVPCLRSGGAGREAPQKPTVNAVQVQTVLPLK